jgi:hypothetical protein
VPALGRAGALSAAATSGGDESAAGDDAPSDALTWNANAALGACRKAKHKGNQNRAFTEVSCGER